MPEALEQHISAEILTLRLILSELIVKVLSCLAVCRVVLVACVKIYVFGLPDNTDLEEVVHACGVESEIVMASDLVTGEIIARQKPSLTVIN